MSPSRLSHATRVAVYVVLVVSAGAAFWYGDRLWAAAQVGSLSIWTALLPACAFTLFVLVYTVDRLLLVKRQNYPSGRAFFQIVLAILFLLFLWPRQASQIQAVRRSTPSNAHVNELLDHSDPRVRAAICELLGLRAEISATQVISEHAERDPSSDVRQRCNTALEHLKARPVEPTP